MPKRTTIEIDEDLLLRAKQALGTPTTRATVEEALREAVEASDVHHANRVERQRAYLEALSGRVDTAVLESEEMWR